MDNIDVNFNPLAILPLVFIAWGLLTSLLDRMACRRQIRHLLEEVVPAIRWEQAMPAPEALVLLWGAKRAGRDAFKLGLLQLVTTRVFTTAQAMGEKGREETYLCPGARASEQLEGSLEAIHQLWSEIPEDPTVRTLVAAAKQKYGSLEGFAEREVKPRLLERGLYEGKSWLSDEGETALQGLEARLARVLREMREANAPWPKKNPRRALLAAVLVAATETDDATQEAWSLAQMVETAAAGAPATGFMTGPHWSSEDAAARDTCWNASIFDSFDRCFDSIDSSVDGCDGGGDGGDGGDGGGGE